MIGSSRLSVILPAAGEGTRFGTTADGLTKPFVEVCGQPIFVHSLLPFVRSKYVDEVIIATREELVGRMKAVVAGLDSAKPIRVIVGGKERQDSVGRALQTIGHDGFVMVHDAVRPFVTEELIARTATMVESKLAVVVAIRPKDTIKRGSGDLVEATLDRKALWVVQTPQAFQVGVLKAAMEIGKQDGFVGTDESVLLERIGQPVHIVEGTSRNMKITTPEDRLLMECMLSQNILI